MKKKVIEPKGYLVSSPNNEQQVSKGKPDFGYIEPLYTKDQLFKRLRLNKTQFDQFDQLWRTRYGVGAAFKVLYDSVDSGSYYDLYSYVWDWDNTGVDNKHDERAIDFAYAYANYDPNHPEETIDVLPEDKWFVQQKNVKDRYRFLSKDSVQVPNFNYGTLKQYAAQFDTEEEAEEWTNPLTEAVKLSGENNND